MKTPLPVAIFAAVLLAAGLAPQAARAGAYCESEAPFAYVWGFEDQHGGREAKHYYYTRVLYLRGGETRGDLVAEFAERARDQFGASPSAKPSRCFSTKDEAKHDLKRRKSMQKSEAARQFEVRW